MTRGSIDFRPATVDVYFAPGADITWRVDINDTGITVGTVAVTINGITPSVSTAASTTNHLIADITLSDTQTAAIGENSISWQLSNTTTGVTVIWVTGTLIGSHVGNRLSTNSTTQVVTSAGTATLTSLVGASSGAALAAHEADTTNIHGIADTSVLATSTSVASAISTHAAASDPHGDRAYAAGLAAGLQPLDSDLTAIAALSTTTYGRALLALADAAALRTTAGLEIGTDVQAYDSDLAAIAALSTTTFGRALLALADAAALRTAGGLGTISTQDASSVSVSGGTITGITDLAVADGGTGASTAAGARTNLGLEIGTDVQAQDAELAAIAGLTSAADRLPYFTGSGTAALATFTAAGRALVDDADAAAQRTTLGLGTIATQAASAVAVTGGSITGITDLAVADGGTGASDAATARTNLIVPEGANVGSTNLRVGSGTLTSRTSGDYNTAVGYNVQTALTSGSENTGMGYNAQLNVSTGANNFGLGRSAQQALSTGGQNLGIGGFAQFGLTTGSDNTSIGVLSQAAGSAGMTGTDNVAVGRGAQYNLTTGVANVAVGNYSGNTTTTAHGQTCVGHDSGDTAAQSWNVTAVGLSARVSGDYATALGASTSATGSGSVAIGTSSAGAGASTSVANEIKLGTASHSVNVPGTLNFTGTTATTVGAAGGASALPATPTGYVVIKIGGTSYKMPYYAM